LITSLHEEAFAKDRTYSPSGEHACRGNLVLRFILCIIWVLVPNALTNQKLHGI